jgi:hypothetical protein
MPTIVEEDWDPSSSSTAHSPSTSSVVSTVEPDLSVSLPRPFHTRTRRRRSSLYTWWWWTVLIVQAIEALAEAFGLSCLLFEIVPILPPFQILTFINLVAVLPFFCYLVSVCGDYFVERTVREETEPRIEANVITFQRNPRLCKPMVVALNCTAGGCASMYSATFRSVDITVTSKARRDSSAPSQVDLQMLFHRSIGMAYSSMDGC